MTILDEKNTYHIDYGTGACNFDFTGTLEDAITEANRGLCYTQLPVSIFIKDDIENIAYLPWYGVQPEEDDIVTATFGNFGFYGEWDKGMIDFELFTRLYSEAKQYDDIDLFTSERGWQDWMDNFSTQEVIFILNKIYEYSQESLQDIRIKLNYSRVALSRAYYIPLRTLENWDRKQNMPDYVEVLIKYTFFIKEITKNEAITE